MTGRASQLPDGLLVSVRSPAEAEAAIAGGVAIVDAKEPAEGPLGAVRADVAAAIVAAVAGRAPCTLACGELAAGADVVADRVHSAFAATLAANAATGFVAMKAGPAGLDAAAWRREFAAVQARLPAGVEAVAVAYADSQAARAADPREIIASAAASGAATLLIDTFDKAGPGIGDLVGLETIADWIAAAARHGLRTAIAGKVRVEDLPALVDAGAAIVGVRSTACGGQRLAAVEIEQVRHLVSTLADVRRRSRRRVTTGA